MSTLLVAFLSGALGCLVGIFAFGAFLVWSWWDDQKSGTVHPQDSQYRTPPRYANRRMPPITLGDVTLKPYPRSFSGVEVPDELPEEL